jgi:hypothetical protein
MAASAELNNPAAPVAAPVIVELTVADLITVASGIAVTVGNTTIKLAQVSPA